MNKRIENKRREFLQATLLASSSLLLGSLLPRQVLAQDAKVHVQNLNTTTALFSGTGANVLAKKAANGDLLVVDGGLSHSAPLLRRSIESTLDSKTISTLVNTHWHPEQTGLNVDVGNRRTRIFAHENTRLWLGTSVQRLGEEQRSEPLPATALPNETFRHFGAFSHGSETVEYGYLRQAHTDGDLYLFLPADNILHAGGVIASDGWPFMDWWTGGWIGGVVDALEVLLSIANDQTLIIPASGPAITKARLIEMRDMYDEIFQQVRTMFVAANTAQQTVAAKPAGAWEAQYGNSDKFIELSHWSLIPHLTPDA